MYQLNLLGCAELRKPDELIELSTRKALAILVYVACQPNRRVFRDRLAAMFWEDADSSRARASLRQAVSIIRRDTPAPGRTAPLLQTEGDLVLVSEDLATDVQALEQAAAGADEGNWQQVANLYKGDFLEGFTVRGAPAFEDWAALERQRLRELALTSLGKLMDAALLPKGSTQQGITAALRVLALDPMQEQAHRALMLLYTRQGRHAAALKQYHGLAETLGRELGIQPESETRELYRTISEGRRNPAASAMAKRGAVTTMERAPEAGATATSADLAPIGRSRGPKLIAARWKRTRLTLAGMAGALAAPIFALAAGGFWWTSRAKTAESKPPTIERVFTIGSGSYLSGSAGSPDGNWVAFASRTITPGNTDIYLKPVSDQPPIRLTSDPAIDINPTWSPDGANIAFVRLTAGKPESCRILVKPIPNGRERLVGRCQHASSSRLAWSADQSEILFIDRPAADATDRLYELQLADGKVTELTHGGDASASDDEPAVSPDGRHVAFLRRSSWTGADIHVLDLETGEQRALTHDGERIWGLAWSPGGKGLLFSAPRGGDVGLWWISISDPRAKPQRVSAGLLEFRHVSVSRMPPRLIFEVYDDKSYFVEGAGSGARPVPGIPVDSSNWFADVGPQGQLAFVSARSNAEQVWASTRGHQPRQLTNMDGWSISEPRWSPDGRRIAFIAAKGGQADLYVVPAKGGALMRLTNDRFEDASPAWAADGKSLYFTSHRDAWRMVRVTPEGRLAPSIPVNARAVRIGGDGSIYYVKDGRPGIWRRSADAGGQETRVVPDLRPTDWINWSVAAGAIYYVRRDADGFSGRIRRVGLAGEGGRDLADTSNLLFAASFAVRPDGRLVLTRRDLQVILMGADLSSR